MNWFLKVLRQYADFKGRARRKEYWMFCLFSSIFTLVATILDNLLGLTFGDLGYGVLYTLVGLALLVPTLAVSVRRLHDVGKSGWMYFIILIPLVGAIWWLVLCCTDGQPGENQWGPNPKETSEGSSDKEDVLDDF